MTAIKLEGLTKSYSGDDIAVDSIDLEVNEGEFLVLVGPSGCGKSTTLRMIAGLEEITDGTISFDERVINDLTPRERNIAMVFQTYALYPQKTVYGNMAFGLKRRRNPRIPKEEIDKSVHNAAKMLGLEELLKRKPKHLSGGQRQRVALARAIVREPDVFLFDEPLSNLDASLRTTTRTEIAKLHQKLKTTMVYVTHDQVEAMTLGTRIAVMNKGKILQLDTPTNLYQKPNNLFIAGFIGTPPMNLIPAHLKRVNGSIQCKLNNSAIAISKERFSNINSRNYEEIIVGIRPENLVIVEKGKGCIQAKVLSSEFLGSEFMVFCEVNSEQVIVKAGKSFNPKMNDVIDIKVEIEHLHLFDPETEMSLL